ncbi:ABC transporter ATP-binding protein [Roseibium aggregatum]|uniref:ABC transporter ATP-binding protein n=1 Tax=Roseibium aggregatum TaxID=187304 RepID=A0A939J2Y9_9HYPH|nr:ABC transporter ATP-binding protein [Roseibium aggregatum]MBN9671923.1 ABC transporter ATP-binding protein [Roseibium aggregatum]
MTLTVKNTAKTFPDGTRALLPTDLTVGEGEILSLLGPSGCGKTTLLRIIAGLEQPDAGSRVFFGETDVTGLAVERRNVGMVFQSYALFPNMSVRANVGYGLKVRHVPKAERDRRVDEVLQLCRLADYADRPVQALSGGQQQRVALARAVAPRPKILLLDEPLSALDAALRDSLRDELAAMLRQFRITAVFVTHDQAEALAIADRIAVMSEGELQQVGAPEDLYHAPASAFVARFIGNAIPLTGERDNGALILKGGRLELAENSANKEVYVRAESIRLDPEGSLAGVVETAVFSGGHYRLAIRDVLSDGALLQAHHPGKTAPKSGDTVRLSISPSDLLYLSDQPSGPK